MADYSGAYNTTATSINRPRPGNSDPSQRLLGDMSNVLKRIKMAEARRDEARKAAKDADVRLDELQQEFNDIREKLVEEVPQLLTGYVNETLALDGEGHVVVVEQ